LTRANVRIRQRVQIGNAEGFGELLQHGKTLC
jgi:hypothetical protein